MIVTYCKIENLSFIVEHHTEMQVRYAYPTLLVLIYIHFIEGAVKYQDVVTQMS